MATSIDPLARFLETLNRWGSRQPIPLVSTRIDVTIRGGLAAVTTERTFRNTEQKTIEATMTFPVPVDATLCSLTAKINGRTLNAVAQARVKARETYEEAVEKGKSAVLHEEQLKGIHTLSVGHVGPGAEIAVTDTWTAPLSFVDATPRLRIPTTVGEIYGRSPLAPSDDLVIGDVVHEATIAIACADGTASLLRAGPVVDGRHVIALDQPIDIVVAGWKHRVLDGVAADGRMVTLDIAPAPKADAKLDVAILFDRSGSMGERVAGDFEISATKLDVAKAGLIKAARETFKAEDRLRVWQFDDGVQYLGESSGAKCAALAETIQGPAGGTEIGRAFDAAIASEKAKNIVIITDGKSWAFDPHRIARTGIRVTAVLIGEDAIEAGIAHLAGMTGGQTFVAAGSEAGAAIAAALDAARAPHQPATAIPDAPSRIEALRRGALATATWGKKSEGDVSTEARQVGATAAMLAIPLMAEEAAAKLAEAEGIVCHLTSLVLVDEAGEKHEGIPAVRKVELSPPMTMARAAAPGADPYALEARASAPAGRVFSAMFEDLFSGAGDSRMAGMPRGRRAPGPIDDAPIAPSSPVAGGSPKLPSVNLSRLVGRIDWESDPDALRNGDLSGFSPDVIAAIQAAAQLPEIIAFADTAGIDRIIAVIGLLAKAASGKNRSAKRIARVILSRASAGELKAAMSGVGL